MASILGLGERHGFYGTTSTQGRGGGGKALVESLSPIQRAKIVIMLCKAFEALHARGIARGCLAAMDVMLTKDGVPKLRIAESGQDPACMAPEVFRVKGRLESDIFLLGALLFEIATSEAALERGRMMMAGFAMAGDGTWCPMIPKGGTGDWRRS
jgi:hypothetical protein